MDVFFLVEIPLHNGITQLLVLFSTEDFFTVSTKHFLWGDLFSQFKFLHTPQDNKDWFLYLLSEGEKHSSYIIC